jgi:hypothetical protein
MGATVGLRALEEAGTALRARVVVAILTVTGGSLGVALADARGAAWGLAAASIVGVGVWWRQFQSATSRNPLLSTRPIQRPLPGRDALLGEGVE